MTQTGRPGRYELEDWAGMLALAAILCVMGTAVYFRYVLNNSISWAEEASRYGLAYVTFLGCSTAARRHTHMRLDILELALPPLARKVQRFAQRLLELGFYVAMTILGVQISLVLYRTPLAASGLSLAIPYAAVVIGSALAAFRVMLALARLVRGRDET